MEHARAEYHSHHEEECNSRIEGAVDDSEHLGLAESADESQDISYEVEFSNLKHISINMQTQTKNHTFVEKGSKRLKLPTKAWKARYVQLRIAYSGEYSQVCKPYP
jgi:hypothetical protein